MVIRYRLGTTGMFFPSKFNMLRGGAPLMTLYIWPFYVILRVFMCPEELLHLGGLSLNRPHPGPLHQWVVWTKQPGAKQHRYFISRARIHTIVEHLVW